MKKLLLAGVMVLAASSTYAETFQHLPSWLPGYDADAIERAQPHPSMEDAPDWLKGPHKKQTHANWNTRFPLPSVALPQEMIGYWCYADSIDNAAHYTRSESGNDCADTTLEVRPDGWSEVWDNCPFTTVEEGPDSSYLIYSYCEYLAEGNGQGFGEYFSRHEEYHIAENGQLVVTQIPEK
jgi:hypothetical protein